MSAGPSVTLFSKYEPFSFKKGSVNNDQSFNELKYYLFEMPQQ